MLLEWISIFGKYVLLSRWKAPPTPHFRQMDQNGGKSVKKAGRGVPQYQVPSSSKGQGGQAGWDKIGTFAVFYGSLHQHMFFPLATFVCPFQITSLLQFYKYTDVKCFWS